MRSAPRIASAERGSANSTAPSSESYRRWSQARKRGRSQPSSRPPAPARSLPRSSRLCPAWTRPPLGRIPAASLRPSEEGLPHHPVSRGGAKHSRLVLVAGIQRRRAPMKGAP